MIAHSTITFDKSYYALYFSDWVKRRSLFRQYAPFIGIVMLMIGAYLLGNSSNVNYIAITFLCIGAYELLDGLTFKSRWIKQRMKTKNPTLKFEFKKDRVHIISGDTQGDLMLDSLAPSTFAENGFFILPQKGLSFYVPWQSIEPTDAEPAIRELLG